MGSAFDFNDDGIPDDCQLLLAGSNLVLGEPAAFDFVGAAPGQPLLWFVSLRGIGVGPCLFGGAVCLDLLPFQFGGGAPNVFLLLIQFADAEGHGGIGFTVPNDLVAGTKVGLQVVAAFGPLSVKSNPIQKIVQTP